jgi:hypothetical protein
MEIARWQERDADDADVQAQFTAASAYLVDAEQLFPRLTPESTMEPENLQMTLMLFCTVAARQHLEPPRSRDQFREWCRAVTAVLAELQRSAAAAEEAMWTAGGI